MDTGLGKERTEFYIHLYKEAAGLYELVSTLWTPIAENPGQTGLSRNGKFNSIYQ